MRKLFRNRSSVNIPPVPGGDHQHEQFRVPDLAEDAVVAHPVAPHAREIGFESFSETAWITITGDPFVEVSDDVALRGLAELPEFLHSGRADPARSALIKNGRAVITEW